jgi:hypothetical protein
MLWWIVELEQAGGLHGVIRWYMLILEVLIAVLAIVVRFIIIYWYWSFVGTVIEKQKEQK